MHKLIRSYYNEVEEIKVWLLALEDKKSNIIRISLRSDQGIIINKVAERYGGGGHKFAAGAKLNSWKELNDVIDDLNREIKKQKN